MGIDTITLGFIGFGNMAQSIAEGLISQHVLRAEQIVASAAHFDKLVSNTSRLAVRALATSQEVARQSDVLIIAVKPNMVEQVLSPVKNDIRENTLVISVAWGINNEQLEAFLPQTHHITAIPNIPISAGKGVLVVEQAHTLTTDQYHMFSQLFEPIALLEVVDSAHISIGGILSSCAPAFTAMYVEALADAGVKFGLTRASAYRLAAKMVEGTGAELLSSGMSPSALKDAVCSPGGATIRGVVALEHEGLRGTVIRGIEAVQGE